MSNEPSDAQKSLSIVTSAVPLSRAKEQLAVLVYAYAEIEHSWLPLESVTSIACPPSPYESDMVSEYSVGASNGGDESAMPSPSVSVQTSKSSGNASAISTTPSLSSSKSALLPVPSLSVSTHSDPSRLKASFQSKYPSLSSSLSSITPYPP